MKHVDIFTDGSCLGNPGPGGYAAVLLFKAPSKDGSGEQVFRKEISQGYKLTTNNRMELLAAICALEALNQSVHATLTTDSQYVRKGITEWIANWKKRGWKTASKQPVKNADLWRRLDEASQRHTVDWKWVKGHSGHPENERCDELGRQAATDGPYLDDTGYES